MFAFSFFYLYKVSNFQQVLFFLVENINYSCVTIKKCNFLIQCLPFKEHFHRFRSNHRKVYTSSIKPLTKNGLSQKEMGLLTHFLKKPTHWRRANSKMEIFAQCLVLEPLAVQRNCKPSCFLSRIGNI